MRQRIISKAGIFPIDQMHNRLCHKNPLGELATGPVVLRGRCEFALKATVDQAPSAHQQLLATQQLLQKFQIIAFDQAASDAMRQLQRKANSNKPLA